MINNRNRTSVRTAVKSLSDEKPGAHPGVTADPAIPSRGVGAHPTPPHVPQTTLGTQASLPIEKRQMVWQTALVIFPKANELMIYK